MKYAIFKEGNDVVGEMDWKLDILCKAACAIIVLLLLNLLLVSIVLSLVIFGVKP
ncbi:hypothetical protein LCGC14_1188180 [marine sediment metagenome]|uniref:Uncharacterized protein n=1 Tax=marine sediment metagenome TaxID=412755 RepID=A0A0F9M7X2_9ZZZZ